MKVLNFLLKQNNASDELLYSKEIIELQNWLDQAKTWRGDLSIWGEQFKRLQTGEDATEIMKSYKENPEKF